MDDNYSHIFENISKFISNFTGVPLNSIKVSSRLENDLKVYGDDAIDLIIAYSKKFNVDITNFSFKGFIGPEGDTLFYSIKENIINSKGEKRSDLTVHNLINGVIQGKLNLEVIGK